MKTLFASLYLAFVLVLAVGFSVSLVPVHQAHADISTTINSFYPFNKPFFEGCGAVRGGGGCSGTTDGGSSCGIEFKTINQKTDYTCGITDFEYYLGKTLKLLIGVGILFSTLAIAWGGFRLIYSQGNPGELQKVKKQLTYIIIGFFFMLTAFLIVKFILTGLGVNQSFYSKIIGS